jgi:hypothetical protein
MISAAPSATSADSVCQLPRYGAAAVFAVLAFAPDPLGIHK